MLDVALLSSRPNSSFSCLIVPKLYRVGVADIIQHVDGWVSEARASLCDQLCSGSVAISRYPPSGDIVTLDRTLAVKTMRRLPFLSLLILCGVAQAQTTTHGIADVFPGKTWVKATPEELGWSRANLDEARKFFDTLPPASLVVVDHGRVAVDWNDSTKKIKISSMRKSILSALYG